jgi:hypothetical protein
MHTYLKLLALPLALCTFAAPRAFAQEGEMKPAQAAPAAGHEPANREQAAANDAPADSHANTERAHDSEAAPARARSEPPTTAADEGKQGRAFIAHTPLSAAPLDHVELSFDVRGHDLAGEIVVYFRTPGSAGAVRSVRAKRNDQGFVATIPSEAITSDAIEYWVVERSLSGEERVVFASSADPQPVFVYTDSAGAREARLLRMAEGRRSRISGKFEWVDMGGYKVQDPKVGDAHDHYYHLEGQYAYRFFRGVEELEFALGRLDGKVLDRDRLERRRVALEYGRTAITFAFGDWFRLRPGVLLGISTQGFEAGFDVAALFGDRDGTEFELSGGYVTHLGGRVKTRLGWCTVPRLPMGASIEVTSFPTNDQFGVRLLFDIGYRAKNGFLVRFLAGYRGRTSLAGGPSLGLEAGYAF